ncbi:MAG: TRAP transporter substrate-binding protein [Paracoccaceae bacterium]|jgi:TRAP-type mannitol/chloroaromatic compound transport system substrate-binding protein
MDRRSFLKTSAVGGTAAAATSLAAPLYAQGKRTLTMVTSVPRGFAVFDDAAQQLEKIVGELSGGSLTIEKKSAGELVGAFEVFDAVTSGQADMYHSADYYFVSQHPALAYFTSVPFGGTATEVATWYYGAGGQELHDELGQIFNFKGLMCGNTGCQPGGWFNKEINSVDDLNGLKFRMPGLGGQALGKLGVSVQNIPGGELYQALSSGAIDGLEWIGPLADERAGFQEVSKIYYTAGFHEPGSALSANVNLDVWNDLSEQHQAVLKYATMSATMAQVADTQAKNAASLANLRASGVKTYEFPDDVWDAFGSASKELMDSYMDDEFFAKVRASYEASVSATSSWLQLSDGEYVSQRNRVLGNS